MAIFDKFELSNYIASVYKERTDLEVSPIKLQKALYFLFAYFGGWASFSNQNQEFNELDNESIDTHLFNATFMAWDYGPVDTEVYNSYKNERANFYRIDAEAAKSVLMDNDSAVFTMIDHLYDQIIDLNDFTLVDVSHKDNAWKENYIKRAQGQFLNAKPITNEEIINEYAERQKAIQNEKAKA